MGHVSGPIGVYNIIMTTPRTRTFAEMYDEAIDYDDGDALGPGAKVRIPKRIPSSEQKTVAKAMQKMGL